MEGKDSFIFYIRWFKYIKKLTDEQKVKLINLMERFVTDEFKDIPIEDISIGDPVVEMAFLPIATDLYQDLDKWKKKCLKNKENISKRWNKENTTVYDRIPNDTSDTDKEYEYDYEYEDDNKESSINTTKENTEQALSTNVDEELKQAPDVLSWEEEAFNEFWKLYPKKVDKKGAFRSFKRIKGLKKEFPTMLEVLKQSIISSEWQKNNYQYVPYPTTWIRQERWKATTDMTFNQFLAEGDGVDSFMEDIKKAREEIDF